MENSRRRLRLALIRLETLGVFVMALTIPSFFLGIGLLLALVCGWLTKDAASYGRPVATAIVGVWTVGAVIHFAAVKALKRIDPSYDPERDFFERPEESQDG